jgi:hypothetical protein
MLTELRTDRRSPHAMDNTDNQDPSLDQSGGSVDLVASTGANDPNSLWYSGLLQTAISTGTDLGKTALQQALQTQTPVTPTNSAGGHPASTTTGTTNASTLAGTSSTGKNSTVLIVVAVVVVVIGWFSFRD